MALFDEDLARKKPTLHEIGQDLSALSLHELEVRIVLLEQEIARLDAAKASKSQSRTVADSVFRSG